MIDLQSVLGTEQATTFVESLQTVIHQLEVRQQHLIEELRDTTATLNAVKQIMGGSMPEATDTIEIATIVALEDTETPHLQATEAFADEDEDEVEPSPPSRNSSTKASAKSSTKTKRRKSSAKLGRRPKLKPKARKAEPSTEHDLADSSADVEESSSEAIATASNFNPRESVLKEFQDQTLRTAIKTILERHVGQPMSTDDILQALYGKRTSQENLQIARRVIVVELSKGKLAGIWASVEGRRGHYMMPIDEDQAEDQA